MLDGSKRVEGGRTLLLALALFVSSTVVFATVPRFEPPFASPLHRSLHSLDRILWWELYAVGLIVAIALGTINEWSVRDAWMLGFAGGAGVGINLGGVGLTGGVPGLPFRMLWAIGLGLATAAIIGTGGYSLGVGLRRFDSSGG